MTPAIELLKKASIAHQVLTYHHDPACTDFGLEAAQQLGVDPAQMYKTLVVRGESGQLVFCLVSVQDKVDLKKLAHVMGCKKAELADPAVAEKTTGYVVGGISPLGGRKSLPTFLDEYLQLWDTIYLSAGKRGMQLQLAPHDLQRLTHGVLADVAVR